MLVGKNDPRTSNNDIGGGGGANEALDPDSGGGANDELDPGLAGGGPKRSCFAFSFANSAAAFALVRLVVSSALFCLASSTFCRASFRFCWSASICRQSMDAGTRSTGQPPPENQ